MIFSQVPTSLCIQKNKFVKTFVNIFAGLLRTGQVSCVLTTVIFGDVLPLLHDGKDNLYTIGAPSVANSFRSSNKYYIFLIVISYRFFLS